MLGRTEIPEIQKGVNIIKDLSADAILRERIRAREDAERDYYSAMTMATKKGLAQGIAQGIEQGIAEGRAKGIAEGRAKGIAEGRADLLKQMLDAGIIDKDTFDKYVN